MDLSKYDDFKVEDFLNSASEVRAFLVTSLEENNTDEFIEAIQLLLTDESLI